MKATNVKTITRNVNNERIFNKVNDFVHEALTTIMIQWISAAHRHEFVDFIDGWLEEICEDGDITQYKVMCDRRNNPPSNADKKIIIFTISYRQTNCLNTTQIDYEINDLENALEDILKSHQYP